MENKSKSKYWKFVNANPKHKFTDDCVIRAFCIAMDTPW